MRHASSSMSARRKVEQARSRLEGPSRYNLSLYYIIMTSYVMQVM